MAITSVDGAIAGMKPTRMFQKVTTPTLVTGKPQSLWGLAGIPGAGSFDTTLNGVTLSSSSALVSGQLPFYDPAGGLSTYLARLVGAIPNGGQLLLCDRLWHNGGYASSTGVQSSTTPTWPARDENGATSGAGVLFALEYNATGAANAPTITCTYTNSAGTGSRTAGFAFATASSPAAGSFFPIALMAGDVGVRSLQSIQLSAAPTAGTINMVAYRVISVLDCSLSNDGFATDILTSGFPQMFNGTVPFLVMISQSSTAGFVSGALTVTQG